MYHIPKLYSAILFVLATLLAGACSRSPAKRVCIRGTCIRAEVAATQDARTRGLMFRKGMAEDKGMLFVFDTEAPYAFWMKNMHFPLDILWIDHNKKIVHVYQNALPCKDVCKNLAPPQPAQFVLEVPAGFVAKHGVATGERVDF